MTFEPTDDWKLYQKGEDYKRKIGQYDDVDECERFYAGNQWEGVVSNGLPTPTFNFLRRVGQYKVSQIMSQEVTGTYSADNILPDDPLYPQASQMALHLSEYGKRFRDKVNLDRLNEAALLDGFVSGDMCAYMYFDASIDTGTPWTGDAAIQLIDTVNVHFGNPNDTWHNLQKQPYILIVFRQMVEDLKEEAKANGQRNLDQITGDDETATTAGDYGKKELDDSGKCNVILKLWKKNGKVYARKSTRYCVIRKDYDTKLTLYPVSFANWEVRKNCIHGLSDVKFAIPNQIFTNKMAAMLMMSTMQAAFPKLLYDKNVITKPTNQIGEAIGVNGPIQNSAQYLTPGNISNDAFDMFNQTITLSKEMLGANETALGEVAPDNTSAIVAIQQATAIPLETVQRRFYDFNRQIYEILLDMMCAYYGERSLTIQDKQGNSVQVPFNAEEVRKFKLQTTVDIGPSNRFSEITTIQTLDKLLQAQIITPMEYLERMPDGYIPQKDELIEAKQLQMQQAQMAPDTDAMAQFVAQLPEEEKARLSQLPDNQLMAAVQQMMGGSPNAQGPQPAGNIG